MRRIVVFVCLAFAAEPALAQSDLGTVTYVAPPGGTSIDGRAKVGDGVYAVLSAAQARPVHALTEADAQQIKAAIMADRRIDADEFDLLDELASWTIRAVRITPASGKGEQIVTGTTSGNTRKVFDEMFAAHYEQAWNNPDKAAGWAELLRQSRFSETGWRRVMRFLTGMTLPAARAANAGNVYKPVTDLASDMFARCGKLSEADRNAGRQLAFEAWKNADLQTKDALPDFLYVWLKPKPA